MSSKAMEEKIEFLDGLAEGTLFLTHYSQWELSSYKKDSMFSYGSGRVGPVRALGFEECVNRAIALSGEGSA